MKKGELKEIIIECMNELIGSSAGVVVKKPGTPTIGFKASYKPHVPSKTSKKPLAFGVKNTNASATKKLTKIGKTKRKI